MKPVTPLVCSVVERARDAYVAARMIDALADDVPIYPCASVVRYPHSMLCEGRGCSSTDAHRLWHSFERSRFLCDDCMAELTGYTSTGWPES